MDNERTPKRVLRRLGEEEAIKSFNCGDADLNDFLFNEAPLYAKALLAITYVYDDKESIEDKDENTRLLFYDLKEE